MYLSICGDPDCPNKREVEDLKAEVERLKVELLTTRNALHTALANRDDDRLRPKFKYPE